MKIKAAVINNEVNKKLRCDFKKTLFSVFPIFHNYYLFVAHGKKPILCILGHVCVMLASRVNNRELLNSH